MSWSLRLSLLTALLFGGCGYYMPNPSSPPPPSARPHTTTTFWYDNSTVPPVIPEPDRCLALADLVDLALENSPKTRAAWYRAKQAAADVGSARGAYLPPVNFTTFWLAENFPFVENGVIFNSNERNYGYGLSTSYLIFDFGGRNGNLLSALSALESLDWIYNWEAQTVMIHTIQSYYDYINAQAIVAADEEMVRDNLTTLEAAAALRKTGVKGLADELQAETSLLQSQIMLEQDIGQLNIARATLVQSLGLPPDSPLLIAELPQTIATEGVCQDISYLMQTAKEKRADLMATRAAVLQNRFRIRTARSALMPTINTSAFGSQQSVNGSSFMDVYALQFNLNIPLFNSFSDINNLRKAQSALLEMQANLDDEELAAFLSVLSDYYELVAYTKILNYSYKYVEIAVKNREVAFANYKTGINTIIDLMIANNALSLARQQLADAKTNFLTSLANIAYDTGGLSVCAIHPPASDSLLLEEGAE